MAQVVAKKKYNFWWPRVDTPDDAAAAAKGGGAAYGIIALGYLIATVFVVVRVHYPVQPDATRTPGVFIATNLAIFAIAAFLAWRTYRRPTLLLCVIALAWVLVEFAGKAAVFGVPNNIIGTYWGPLLGTIAGLGGVRGALAQRKFSQTGQRE
jgi:hypothetical protein